MHGTANPSFEHHQRTASGTTRHRQSANGDEAKEIGGVKVVGKTADIPRKTRELGADHVIIAIAQLSRADMQRIIGVCKKADVKVKTIPGLSDLLEEKVVLSRIRDVEVEDLLGRSPVELDRQSIETFLAGKTVLVTGAGDKTPAPYRQATVFPL